MLPYSVMYVIMWTPVYSVPRLAVHPLYHFLGALMNFCPEGEKNNKTQADRCLIFFTIWLLSWFLVDVQVGHCGFIGTISFWEYWPTRVNENISDNELKSSSQLLSLVIILHENPWSHLTPKLPIVNSLGWTSMSPDLKELFVGCFFCYYYILSPSSVLTAVYLAV